MVRNKGDLIFRVNTVLSESLDIATYIIEQKKPCSDCVNMQVALGLGSSVGNWPELNSQSSILKNKLGPVVQN